MPPLRGCVLSDMSEDHNVVASYVRALLDSERLGDQVVYHKTMLPREAVRLPNTRPWSRAIQDILAAQGIEQLYSHQAMATDMVRAGRHVVVATPTASGKTLVYNLPILETFLQDPECRALYLFPLKALAQDQLKNLEALTAHWPADARPRAAVYDGDTTDYRRRKIRESPPNMLLTNPEMVHLSICPHHETWSAFLAGLQFVVVDEVHTYRGVLGSHMAQVFRRLLRICRRYGARPTFVFCSATVANPAELARRLTGLEVETVLEKRRAPRASAITSFSIPWKARLRRLSCSCRPPCSAVCAQSSTPSRARSRNSSACGRSSAPAPYRERISAYRAGFLPEERREIEAKMASGELLAVVSTSALELGIDIGALDLCVLVGYPGTVMSTLQRGGRVGRSMRESAVALIAHEDAPGPVFHAQPASLFRTGRGSRRAQSLQSGHS